MKQSKRHLFFLLLIYCIVLLPILLSISEPSMGELERGALAAGILEGLRLPLWDYQVDPYGAGSLLAGIWTVPFFAVFGKSLFALKLAPFCWHILSLITWYFVWQAHFTPRQTFFILLFFAFPLPGITKYTLYNNGYHFEAILWIGLSILIFRKLLSGELSEVKGGIFLGLLGGFSSWMDLTNLVTISVIGIYLILMQPSKIRKSAFFFAYFSSFLIAFCPWLFYNWHFGWGGVEFLSDIFLKGSHSAAFQKNPYFTLRECLIDLFGFQSFDPPFKTIFARVFIFCYLSSLVWLLWKKRSDLRSLQTAFDVEVFGLFFQILLLGLVLATGLAGRGYYLFPLVPFMGMTLVLACMRLKKLQVFFAIFFIGTAFWGNINLFVKEI